MYVQVRREYSWEFRLSAYALGFMSRYLFVWVHNMIKTMNGIEIKRKEIYEVNAHMNCVHAHKHE